MDRLRILAVTNRCFSTAEAHEAGYDDKAIARAIRHKLWVRVRHGAYTFADLWYAADEIERHRILSAAVMRSYGDRVALTHTSAAIDHGLRVWDVDLRKVHVTRLDGGAGRTERDVVHHECQWGDAELERRGGFWVATAARAALETATLADEERGLVVFDSAIHLKKTDDAELSGLYSTVVQHWPNTRRLHVGLSLMDGGAESVGETRSRYLCWVHGLPAPQTQFEVYDRDGRLVGTTDLGWPEQHLLGEFDGKIKYGRLLKDGQQPTDVVFAEKVREDLIREALLEWNIIRLIWADLYRGAETARRIRRLMRAAA